MNNLTSRQQEVYNLIALEGLNYKQVAERLHISIHTVERHRDNIFQKLLLNDRADLIFRYYTKEKAPD